MSDGKTRFENDNHHDVKSLVAQCQLCLPGIVRQVCQRFHRHPNPDKIEDYCDEILLLLLADDDRYLKTFDPAKASLKTWLTAVTEHELGYKFKHEP